MFSIILFQALMIGRLTRSLPYIETSAMNNFRSAKEAIEVAVLRHVGKLNNRHPVFQRQRTVEKTFKEIQKDKKKSPVQREHTPCTPEEMHGRCISYQNSNSMGCCLSLSRVTWTIASCDRYHSSFQLISFISLSHQHCFMNCSHHWLLCKYSLLVVQI